MLSRFNTAEITEKWPWWAQLHAFWHKLPHYNSIPVANSTPGQDRAAEAGGVDGYADGAEATENDKLPAGWNGVQEYPASGRDVEPEIEEPLNDEVRQLVNFEVIAA
jgi:hypothetical protein